VLGLPHLASKVHIAVGLVCVYLAGLELWFLHYNDQNDSQRHR
jgi:hypothetical protein